MAAESSLSEPASSRPAISRTTGASAPPNVVQPTTPRVEARAREVAGVVGGGVDPAEPVAGHGQHQRADERRGRAAGQGRDRGPVHVVGDEHDVDDGEDAGHPGDGRLHAHDRVEAEDPAADDERGHDQQGDDLGRRPAAPAELVEDLRGRQRRQRDQRRLPADGQHPGQHRGDAVAVHAERGAAEHEGRRRAALAGDGDQAAEQERDDDPDHAGDDGLPEGDAEARAGTSRRPGRRR